MEAKITRLMGWFQDVEGVKRFIPADQPPPPSCTAVFDVEVEDGAWTGVERLEVPEADLTEVKILAAAEALAAGEDRRRLVMPSAFFEYHRNTMDRTG